MKAVRIIAAIFAVIVVVTVIAIFVAAHYRDSIARQIAAGLLAPYDMDVEAVAVGSITAEFIDFDVIVLRYEDGTRIQLHAVTLPVSTRGLAGLEVAGLEILIDRVQITRPAVRQDPRSARPDVAAIIDQLVELPALLPDTNIKLSSLALSGYPDATNIRWQSDAQHQRLTAEIESYTLNATMGPDDAGQTATRLLVTAAGQTTARLLVTAADREAVDATLALKRESAGYSIAGSFTLAAPPLLPAFVELGWLPAQIRPLETGLDGEVTITVPDDTAEPIPVSATGSLRVPLDLRYETADGTAATVRILDASAAEARLEYPSLDWHMTTADVGLRVTYGAIRDLPLRLRQIACTRGTRCTLEAVLERTAIDPGIGVPVGVSVDAPGIELSLRDGDWRVVVAEASLDVDGITGPGDLQAALPVRLDAVTIENGGASVRAGITVAAADVRLLGHKLIVPAISGDFSRSGGNLTLVLEVDEHDRALNASVNVTHDLTGAETRIVLDDAQLDFSGRALSSFVEHWPYDWDVVAGTWTAGAEISRQSDGGLEFSAAQALDGVAGRYQALAFTGLTTDLAITGERWPPERTLPVSLSLDLLEVGFPIEGIEADLKIDADPGLVAVERLDMETLGGRVAVDPFVFDPAAATRQVVLRPESVQLQLMTNLANLPALEVSGSVSGVVPITIDPDGITIEGGRLIGDPPGGAIRYQVTGCTEEVMRTRSGLAYARCVLTDYEFDSLTSDLSYGKDGNLVLEMRLTGVNPQYDPEQPVNLNPKLETNVMDLIRSLQAARSIEEIFNRQLGQ